MVASFVLWALYVFFHFISISLAYSFGIPTCSCTMQIKKLSRSQLHSCIILSPLYYSLLLKIVFCYKLLIVLVSKSLFKLFLFHIDTLWILYLLSKFFFETYNTNWIFTTNNFSITIIGSNDISQWDSTILTLMFFQPFIFVCHNSTLCRWWSCEESV